MTENGINTIFIDCFDTIIFRKEHPLLFLRRWATVVSNLYPTLVAEDIYRLRRVAQQKFHHVDDILKYVYSLQKNNLCSVTESEFLLNAHKFEVEIEKNWSLFLCR